MNSSDYGKIREILAGASRIIGIGSISLDDISHYKELAEPRGVNSDEYRDARTRAAEYFLDRELKINLNEIGLVKTKLAVRSQILWLELESKETVKEIYTRAADIKNSEIKLRYFTPPEFFDRIKVLENLCWKARTKAKDSGNRLKTQVRLGFEDIELHVREGSEEYWRQVNPDMFGSLPAINLKARVKNLTEMTESPPKGRRKRGRTSPQLSPERSRRRVEEELETDGSLPSWLIEARAEVTRERESIGRTITKRTNPNPQTETANSSTDDETSNEEAA